ncbi:MAG: hypothetical protein ACK5OS_07190 [Chryseotalea sp.]|jgi:hypothetical protein
MRAPVGDVNLTAMAQHVCQLANAEIKQNALPNKPGIAQKTTHIKPKTPANKNSKRTYYNTL